MTIIIPAINAGTFDDVSARLKKIETLTEWVHIDVADGTLTPNVIWHHAPDLLGIATPLKIEVHLMLDHIDARYQEWLLPAVTRLIVHLEASEDPSLLVDKVKEAGKEVVVGIMPETHWEKSRPFWNKIDGILLLSVSPGYAGQKMHDNTIEKIRGLHEACPSCILEVDGGVNAENIKVLAEAGAMRFAAAHAIFGEEDIGKAIDTLKNF
ncbi:MAG: hypothetical protein Q8O83_01545 [bacterium]|nr:hypothetical protein [bacterium]